MGIAPLDLFLGFVPGLLWLTWVRRKDDWEPEPLRLVVRVFALGVAAAWVVNALRPRLEILVLPPHLGLESDLLDAFVVTALSEESFKLLAFYLGALWCCEWDEPLDGIVYGAAAGLGFASLENVVFLAHTQEASVLLGRSFTATLAHVVFSGSCGLAFGVAKLHEGLLARSIASAGFAAAVLAHGIYDALLMAGGGWAPLALVIVLPLLCVAFGLQVRWARARSEHFHPALEP